ncbi:precorrin-2 C(20)-methyltransferase [Rhodoferax sp. 4810]|uniref:Precorrin-2 C(20)-methyltransferase n=1 Tax=Thiospirillum jenense TaxID=1653858 RepID=A0A839HE49_9GAMM|nr:precorrin-2 C(20)-methyltransferase [Thiospirillum jenense]MBB1074215.1 precorrin-2 C(20)-methyltransferase [Rhodoferax jenense]MBB1125289.1 precorrin-2 C(20)-methyltransferase [Thiospirillum jenense]
MHTTTLLSDSNPRIGRLIGVSLGPGDPDLITRRAWALLKTHSHWRYPISQAGAESYALNIIHRAGLAIPAAAAPLHFPMTRDPTALAAAWLHAGQTCLTPLLHGHDVLFLVEGDASTYSTFGHLARTVRSLAPQVTVEIIPGITSFHAAAAALTTPLVEQNDTLIIAAATADMTTIARHLDQADTLVLLKIKPVLPQVLDLLRQRGVLAQAQLVEHVGSPDERIVRDLQQWSGAPVAYLSLLIVRNSHTQSGCH